MCYFIKNYFKKYIFVKNYHNRIYVIYKMDLCIRNRVFGYFNQKKYYQKEIVLSSAEQKKQKKEFPLTIEGKEEAVKWLKLSADQGNADAQNLYGLFLKDGEGVAMNQRLAIQYIEQAAKQGHAEAQYNLGCALQNGTGCVANTQQAIYWFTQAVQQGNADAEYNLGVFYMNGIGVAQDMSRAISLFRSASKKGKSDASYNLGVIYGQPMGVPLDLHESKKWFQIAAQQGDEDAAEKIREVDQLISSNSSSTANGGGGGCYIATAVYGSYDCPPVWTLRRYRDNVLDTTWYGKLFIKTYYAISPVLVKFFGKQNWFISFWKRKLDGFVSKLQANGFESSSYNDKY